MVKNKKEEKNPVHIRLEYNESLEFKKDYLSIEVSLLKILKKINLYNSLRLKEMETKILLQKKFREAKIFLTNTQKSLPELEVPEIKEVNSNEFKENKVKSKKAYTIEEQLREIQRKLDELQTKN